ncbi:hypothetical protein FB451DRAFT_1191187 [Mycena latifolia]|nr:hypothetical protein FB451DRAFT_1191187 [Mycena latifolia]
MQPAPCHTPYHGIRETVSLDPSALDTDELSSYARALARNILTFTPAKMESVGQISAAAPPHTLDLTALKLLAPPNGASDNPERYSPENNPEPLPGLPRQEMKLQVKRDQYKACTDP